MTLTSWRHFSGSRPIFQKGKCINPRQSGHVIYWKNEHKKLRRLVKKLLRLDQRQKSYDQKCHQKNSIFFFKNFGLFMVFFPVFDRKDLLTWNLACMHETQLPTIETNIGFMISCFSNFGQRLVFFGFVRLWALIQKSKTRLNHSIQLYYCRAAQVEHFKPIFDLSSGIMSLKKKILKRFIFWKKIYLIKDLFFPNIMTMCSFTVLYFSHSWRKRIYCIFYILKRNSTGRTLNFSFKSI